MMDLKCVKKIANKIALRFEKDRRTILYMTGSKSGKKTKVISAEIRDLKPRDRLVVRFDKDTRDFDKARVIDVIGWGQSGEKVVRMQLDGFPMALKESQLVPKGKAEIYKVVEYEL